MKIYPKTLVSLAALVFLVSMSLTIALRSIQAKAGNLTEEKISPDDGLGKLNNQGQIRTYQLYTPSYYQPDQSMPLVLVFHGNNGTGASIAEVTRFNKLAEQKGFIVVYPDGINHNWHLKNSSHKKVDDFSFVATLIDKIKQIRNIDSHRIYATGFSKGAIFAQDLACELPSQFAAVASVAGSLPVRLKYTCQPKSPVSMLMINGTNDQSVHYEGDDKSKKGALISIPEAVELWRKIDGCTSSAQVEHLPDPSPSDYFKVKTSHYSGCSSGAEVMLAAIENAGHLWPGGASTDPNVNQFNNKLGFNASQTIWDFFQRHVSQNT